jgi:hypothetical protein
VRARVGAFAADALCVTLFALIGRASHAEGVTLGGLAETAWPFLAALVLGWTLVRASLRVWPSRMWHVLPIWLCTVFGGMAFRAMTGQGTAFSFVVVALLVLGVLLVGWRAVVDVRRFTSYGLGRWSRAARHTRSSGRL